jgi:hypothetical protein
VRLRRSRHASTLARSADADPPPDQVPRVHPRVHRPPGIPPSFDEIARHFAISTPSVNNMVKALEQRGFLARVPGQARTLRVLVPVSTASPADGSARSPAGDSPEFRMAVTLASAIIERLVPALKGVEQERLFGALAAVGDALDTVCRGAGVSAAARREAAATLLRVASIAQGVSPETRPGRRLPWWQRVR